MAVRPSIDSWLTPLPVFGGRISVSSPGDDPLATQQAIQPDWNACAEVARTHGKSFFMASKLLPPHRRQAILAAYAYCRIADDIVDQAVPGSGSAVNATLDDWEKQLLHPKHPVAIAFRASRDHFQIPLTPVQELFAGLRSDLESVRFADWEGLRDYCYLVAGTVGLIVAPILGCRDQRALAYAAELGIAMQLTNILRDVREDADLGRLYLPLDEIEAFGVSPHQILTGNPGVQFPAFMQFQIARARALYSSAMHGVPALAPSGQFATLAASQFYSGILSEIEALNFDVFASRAHLSSTKKLLKLGKATTQLAVSVTTRRFEPPEESESHQEHGV